MLSSAKVLNVKPNEELFEALLVWRDETAQDERILASLLFSEQTLAAVAAKRPPNLETLNGIKDIGPEKTNRYGAVILTHIRQLTVNQHLRSRPGQPVLILAGVLHTMCK